MILSRTPFRVTLGGGGTDLPAYYRRHGGHVLAMALDKFMYVAVNSPCVGRMVRVNYSRNEIVDHPSQLRHELAREALLRHGITKQIEITSMADLPAATGLGSSSCYLVALLNALRAYKREYCSHEELAEEACSIEIETLRSTSVGKQDPYMAAFGGLTVFEIEPGGKVHKRRAKTNAGSLTDFIANMQLYWTGLQQSPALVIADHLHAVEQTESPAHEKVVGCLHRIKEISHDILAAMESENYDTFGGLMDEHWQQKKKMSAKVSIPGIDELYGEVKKRFGVLGGKVAGAGGGGFFAVYAPKNHDELNQFMLSRGLQRLHYNLDFEGVKTLVDTPDAVAGDITGQHYVLPGKSEDRPKSSPAPDPVPKG